MDFILFDTCIVLHLIRGKDHGKRTKEVLNQFDPHPIHLISVVTKAELETFMLRNNWGQERIERLRTYLKGFTVIDISDSDKALIRAYAQIDAYSSRKGGDARDNLLKGAARNMQKNDLWIAATSFVLEVPLITSDRDFDHLEGSFLQIIRIEAN